MKKGYKVPIEALTLENTNFRKVLYTGAHMQLVLMSLLPKEDIGMEIHKENDQFFRFESGTGKVGAEHNVINESELEPLRFYTIYAPSHHKDGIVRATKQDAIDNEADFDGTTSE